MSPTMLNTTSSLLNPIARGPIIQNVVSHSLEMETAIGFFFGYLLPILLNNRANLDSKIKRNKETSDYLLDLLKNTPNHLEEQERFITKRVLESHNCDDHGFRRQAETCLGNCEWIDNPYYGTVLQNTIKKNNTTIKTVNVWMNMLKIPTDLKCLDDCLDNIELVQRKSSFSSMEIASAKEEYKDVFNYYFNIKTPENDFIPNDPYELTMAICYLGEKNKDLFSKSCSKKWSGRASKVWGNNQCEAVGRSLADLDSCKKTCQETPNCSAINFKPSEKKENLGSNCVLRKCGVPAPQPTWKIEGWEGYFMTTGIKWSTSNVLSFSNTQCSVVGNFGVSLKYCKLKCEATKDCNALNYKGGMNGCVLRKCPNPIPHSDWVAPPGLGLRSRFETWKSYHMESGFLVCPDEWRMFKDNCYKYNAIKAPYEVARRDCISEGGDLASIHSSEEQAFVEEVALQDFWLGGVEVTENVWEWSDGSSWNFTNWHSGQPFNGQVLMSSKNWGFKWNDQVKTFKPLHYVCKKIGKARARGEESFLRLRSKKYSNPSINMFFKDKKIQRPKSMWGRVDVCSYSEEKAKKLIWIDQLKHHNMTFDKDEDHKTSLLEQIEDMENKIEILQTEQIKDKNQILRMTNSIDIKQDRIQTLKTKLKEQNCIPSKTTLKNTKEITKEIVEDIYSRNLIEPLAKKIKKTSLDNISTPTTMMSTSTTLMPTSTTMTSIPATTISTTTPTIIPETIMMNPKEIMEDIFSPIWNQLLVHSNRLRFTKK